MRFPVLALSALLLSGPVAAISANELLVTLASEASAADPAFGTFSAQRGEIFYRTRHGSDWSCSTCHTDNPAALGRHTVTGKEIRPLAPAANEARFSNPANVDKWFRRNCNDVLKRACTPGEKGDLLAYLLSVKR